MSKTIATFGEQIRILREEAMLSLREVAEQIGIDTSLLGKIERTDRQPTKEQIRSLLSVIPIGCFSNQLLESFSYIGIPCYYSSSFSGKIVHIIHLLKCI
jgi:transcriptional regulator with XRE-family HTH domain